jgi:hypothetical protein
MPIIQMKPSFLKLPENPNKFSGEVAILVIVHAVDAVIKPDFPICFLVDMSNFFVKGTRCIDDIKVFFRRAPVN